VADFVAFFSVLTQPMRKVSNTFGRRRAL
jgi:hypothetical protein